MTTAVREASPDAVSLDEAFKAAMEGPAKPREADAPPEVDHDAPHGREDDGTPKAPFGLTKDGKPRKGPQGRPAKADQPRTAPAAGLPAKPGSGPAGAKPGAAYAEGLDSFCDGVWMGGSIVAIAGPRLPLAGKYIPGDKIAAASGVIHSYKPRLVAALCLAADHSNRARRLAEKIDQGDATWAIVAGMLVMPCIQELSLVLSGDKALAEAGLPELAEQAEANRAKIGEYMQQAREQMEAQAAQLAAARAQQEAA